MSRWQPSPVSRTPDRGRALLAAVSVTPLLRWAALVHAVPSDQPWRHQCPHCEAPLGLRHNLSAMSPRARCGACQRRVGPPPYTVEVVTVVAAALVVAAAVPHGTWWQAAATGVWAAVGVSLTFIDLSVHRLPFRPTLPAAGAALALLGVGTLVAGDAEAWVRAALAGVGCGLGFALVTLIFGTRAFGLGDAGLALGAGILLGWLGWAAVLVGLFLAFLGSGVVATFLLVTGRAGRRDALPFGPYLTGGTLLTLAWLA